MRLKNVLVAELHALWYIAFLEHYIAAKIIPRSLRWQVYPDQVDDKLNDCFCYFNDAGIKLLELFVNRKKKVSRLRKEIGEIKEKLAPFNKEESYQVYSRELKEMLAVEEEAQRIKKCKKYFSDVNDYKLNNVFKWQGKIGEGTSETPTLPTSHNVETFPKMGSHDYVSYDNKNERRRDSSSMETPIFLRRMDIQANIFHPHIGITPPLERDVG